MHDYQREFELRSMRTAFLQTTAKRRAKVLSFLQQVGAKLKKEMASVEYLGFHISGEGIRPTQEKRQAILNAPAPYDIHSLSHS